MAQSLELLLEEAFAHHKAGRTGQAEALYRQILASEPRSFAAMHHLGLIAHQTGHHADALPLLRRSIELSSNPPAYYHINLGNAARLAGNSEEALEALLQAQKLAPDDPGIAHELGLTYDKLGRLPESAAQLQRAIELGLGPAPLLARAYQNLGSVLLQVGDRAKAEAAIDQAIRLNPQYPLAHMSKASLLFLRGDLQSGWLEYEWRWQSKGFPTQWPNWPQPAWDGSPLRGRTLLLWPEQGLGDAIQFVRYATQASQQGGRVTVVCASPLQRLFATLPSSVQIVAEGNEAPPFDVHFPLMSLPRVFGTRLETVPSQVPYLRPDPQLAAAWLERMPRAAPGRALRAGLVWAGRPTHKGDASRSIPLRLLSALLAIADVQFYSLQKGDRANDLRGIDSRLPVIDWTNELGDFADTAALMAHLDLVISVDTAVAHLAGALAKEVWTLLAYSPDFRWMAEGDASPWYPTMRLFRQQSLGDWPTVVARVAEELVKRVRANKAASPE
jgi:tetratricopeptide (TPR) repeat protein